MKGSGSNELRGLEVERVQSSGLGDSVVGLVSVSGFISALFAVLKSFAVFMLLHESGQIFLRHALGKGCHHRRHHHDLHEAVCGAGGVGIVHGINPALP